MTTDFYLTPMTPELMCTNIKESVAFYLDILGFNIQYERIDDGFAMLERQGSRLMLDEIIPNSDGTWTAGPLELPYGRGINLQIQTSQVKTLYDTVKGSPAKIFLELEEKWYRRDMTLLGNKQFIVLDPDGYMLRFFEYLGEKPA
ncbi:MAG: VOC family protein [Alphaproteobacteria bacterium]|nr:VOC family protein [Alphaproteobacteria bacterium]